MARISLHTFIRHLCRRCRAEASGLTDADLLERFATQRDEAAFEVLVWRHGGLVLGVCQRLLRYAGDVEDVFQATFLTLVRKARSIRRREALGSWLYRVAYRMAVRLRLQRAKREQRQTSDVDTLAAAEVDDPSRRELGAALDDEVSQLPERYRAPVVLCYLQGLTTSEAARVLGCPQGTVLSRLAWARQRLRNRLVRRGLAPAALGTLPLVETATASPAPALVAAVVRAALPFAAGRASVLSPEVAALTQGALQAMLLSKIKMTVALVLVASLVGVAGTGAGWRLFGRAAANTPAAAGENQEQPSKREAASERERQRNLRVTQVRDQLAKAEAEAEDVERRLTDQLIEARLRLIELEFQLRRLEHEQTRQRDAEAKVIMELRLEVMRTEDQMKEWKARGPQPEAEPGYQRLKAELPTRRARLQEKEAELASAEEPRTKEYLRLRKEMIREEERFRSLEGQQAIQRDKAAASREAAAERLRQLEDESAPVDPAERRLLQLERTLERLRRELGELRRELRREK
jgi:RNA polymerase sigma factor (sigma-70 family)